jgi:sulfane dehydrogenase subunit SoxC
MAGDQHDRSALERETLPAAAGNGLIDRRALLRGGAGIASLWAIPVWPADLAPDPDGPATPALPASMRAPGAPFTNYGRPADAERGVIRWIAANAATPGNGVSWCPLHRLEGTIVPNGLHFERHHNGVPDIDPTAHQLVIHGKVSRALAFDVDALLRYPMVSQQCFIECGGNSNAGWNNQPVQGAAGHVHGLVSNSEWVGVPLAVLLDEAGLDADATWAIAEGADGFAMSVSLPVEKLLDDAMLALYQNGERLRPENGYPMRLVLPGWEGVLNVKWLRRLHLTDRPAMTRNETARYTDLLPDGTARMFSFVMDAKSLITSPSSGMQLAERGLYELKGLAWSGRGRITRVEVSADGGQTWADAVLDGPVRPKCFTRFRSAWRWQGQPGVLCSRATDETGYVQPARDVLLAERGRHGYFHYNAIVTWGVDEDGRVSHVYR